MKKIILFGTGNLGKRYLQAILAANGDFRCFCYDISHEAVDSVDTFLASSNIPTERLVKRYDLKEVIEDIDHWSLVIVASTANNRFELVSQIIGRHPEVMIIEKPVAQTIDDFIAIRDACRYTDIPAYTHYTLRFQPFSKTLKKDIDQSMPFEFTSFLPEMGIACVSIHYIDLFLWLSGVKESVMTAYVCDGTYEQKRKGFFDMYGEIVISNGKCTGRFINSKLNGMRSFGIVTEEKTVSVYEDQRFMTVLDKKDKKAPVISEIEYHFASKYMTRIINNFLQGDINSSGELVSLDEAFYSHRVVYEFMEKTGNRELNIT